VRDAGARATLEYVLALYLDDATAWTLDGAGEWTQRAGTTPGAQALLADGVVRAAAAAEARPSSPEEPASATG
jgi:hypothetical protein